MTHSQNSRAIIFAPGGRDAAVASGLLVEAGIANSVHGVFAEFERALDGNAYFALITEEAIRASDMRSLTARVRDQPPWSDLPFVILTRREGDTERAQWAMKMSELLGNVTFLERPFHASTFVSVARTAIKGRQRQYEARGRIDELHEAGERLRTALAAGRMGSWELDVESWTLNASATCKALYGRSPDADFTHADLVAGVHPDDRDRMEEAMRSGIETGAEYAIEYRFAGPDGLERWIEVRARLAQDGTSRNTRLAGVASDITTRRTSENALRQVNETLELRVAERAGELSEAHEAVLSEIRQRERAEEKLRQSQKMEMIGQLTGGVAHDFNNLLMAVMGNLDLLRKRLSDDPRAARLIDGALQGAKRGVTLTQRLLAFARQQDLRAVPVDLRKLIQGMIELLERSLGPRVALRIDIPPGLPPASIDANQLELAILNLAINARDAMPDGGSITIAVSRCQAVSDPVLRSGSYLKVSVIDTGAGMTPEILKRAVEPFFSSKPLGKGTGLGLSMVHGLAVQLGGALQLSSTVGKGTVATLVLPVATAQPEAESEPSTAHKVNRSAVILFVDDDPLIAMSTVEMLEDLGHRVIGANSGLHALDILKSEQEIDLMMTDHVMPGMTGIELAAASRVVRPTLPILLATGYAELPEGAQLDLPRLAKPYHQDQLRDRLDQLLG